MFAEVDKNNEHFKKYMNMLVFRFTMGNLEVEESASSNIIDSENAMKISDNLDAFKCLFYDREDHSQPLTETEIKKLVSIITSGEIASNYRRLNVLINGSPHGTSDAPDIPGNMMYLLHNYAYMQEDWDPFLREAFFHIELERIHPFDDGNGRVGRIIMAYNLCRQNIAPAIITRSDKPTYIKLIQERDYKAFADFLRELSQNESKVMDEVLHPEVQITPCVDEPKQR